MRPLPDEAMPEAIVRHLCEAIARAQACPLWPEPRLVAFVARAQKELDCAVAADAVLARRVVEESPRFGPGASTSPVLTKEVL